MSRQRRTSSTEFKREAATLVLDQGYTVVEACPLLVSRWRRLKHSQLSASMPIEATAPTQGIEAANQQSVGPVNGANAKLGVIVCRMFFLRPAHLGNLNQLVD